jgi:hypothetical protein
MSRTYLRIDRTAVLSDRTGKNESIKIADCRFSIRMSLHTLQSTIHKARIYENRRTGHAGSRG